ncbi:transcription factor E2F7 isoform X1 [Entelurus aequoreus]|uniref:transcription factor E2F7 isoform X1 n=1 Tax=Entelurus aequoreus TaxID=161455 RepID=UPI002B1D2817|nr:transcription factor E2F7 isoform X1 [Entelurus aequoreus]XP_061923048.1 transcription factor E2F7 isoform X1 [Entelurus aequoreus]XP_061923049.1 transcription factor E2F7 isoform X1 [Entelurus aequoreus]XP_061923050.1 transcription factor E2F7 isoform X1 [Entelurus aequoreus]
MEVLALKDLSSPRKSVPEEDGGRREQKENICTVRRRSTPIKFAESCVPGLRRTPDLDHVTPIKHANAAAEPWTPTANLKMLISAASPDIRDREMKEKKVLFRPIENESQSADIVSEDVEFEAAVEEDEDAEKKPSRKQKSLGLLCQKFLALYPDYPPSNKPIVISLDEVATGLGMERRRIYDIINVLESLMMVGRMEKNSYTWHGRLRLEATLEDLQQRGRQHGYHLHMEHAVREAGPSHESDGGDDDNSHAAGNRKDKSLRIMSQKFVMLFLVSKTQTVTLEAAAKVLIEESQDSSSHSKYKTKVRRLYDIANVLTSLGLIQKVHVREERGRKPAFRWLGPVHFNKSSPSADLAPLPSCPPIAGQDPRKARMVRHASFNAAPTSAAAHRRVSSAPSSPHREPAGCRHQPLDYSRRTGGDEATLTFANPKGSALAPPSSTMLVHPEQLFTLSSSPPCLAYMAQPSVVMLYKPPPRSPAEGPAEGPRLPGDGRKRRREDEEEELAVKRSQKESQSGVCSPASDESVPTTQPSHYLYVPNNAGLKSLNFLLPSGQPPAHLPLPPGAVSPMLPYILVPSSALSHYPLLADAADPKVSFNLPAHFMVAAAPQVGKMAPVSSPTTPEQSGRGGRGAEFAHSPPGHPHTARATTPLTPHTPKETPVPSSRAFFQTPGTAVEGGGGAPAARRRGSAQRRLDVSHPST